MDIPVSGPTFTLTDSIAFDSKINDLTKVKPPTKEETHSLTLIIMVEQKYFVGSLCSFTGCLLFIHCLNHCATLSIAQLIFNASTKILNKDKTYFKKIDRQLLKNFKFNQFCFCFDV